MLTCDGGLAGLAPPPRLRAPRRGFAGYSLFRDMPPSVHDGSRGSRVKHDANRRRSSGMVPSTKILEASGVARETRGS